MSQFDFSVSELDTMWKLMQDPEYEIPRSPGYYPHSARREIIKMFPDMTRGDIVREESQDYRNEGVAIFNGDDIVPLCYEIDGYGTVPPEFTIDEFPLDYWYDTITHNHLVWLPNNTMKEFFDNLDGNKTYVRGIEIEIAYKSLENIIDEYMRGNNIPIDNEDGSPNETYYV